MFQVVDMCLVHYNLHKTPDRVVNESTAFKCGEFRGHMSGGMKSGVSAHCARQLD